MPQGQELEKVDDGTGACNSLFLTEQQCRFVSAILAGNKVPKASELAGVSVNTGYGWMRLDHVARLVEHRRKAQLSHLDATVEAVLTQLVYCANFDPRKLFDQNGKPIPVQELDDATAMAIAGIDVMETRGRGDESDVEYTVKKYRTVDKKGSLELIGKYLKMFTERIEVSGVDELSARLAKARANAGIPGETNVESV